MAEFRTVYSLQLYDILDENYEYLRTYWQMRQFGYLTRLSLTALYSEYVCTRELGRSCLHSEIFKTQNIRLQCSKDISQQNLQTTNTACANIPFTSCFIPVYLHFS
jgi:hypothetical protein